MLLKALPGCPPARDSALCVDLPLSSTRLSGYAQVSGSTIHTTSPCCSARNGKQLHFVALQPAEGVRALSGEQFRAHTDLPRALPEPLQDLSEIKRGTGTQRLNGETWNCPGWVRGAEVMSPVKDPRAELWVSSSALHAQPLCCRSGSS